MSIVDDDERVMEVVVEDKQLSLAIGKKGQNVRLAAKLTGWRIDIKSEEEKRKEVEVQFEGLEMPATASRPARRRRRCWSLPDIHDEIVGALREAGYTSADMVVGGVDRGLMDVPGIDEATAESGARPPRRPSGRGGRAAERPRARTAAAEAGGGGSRAAGRGGRRDSRGGDRRSR